MLLMQQSIEGEAVSGHARTPTQAEEWSEPLIPLAFAQCAFVGAVLVLAAGNALAFADGPSLMDSHIPTPVALTSLAVVIGATWAAGRWSNQFAKTRDLKEMERRDLKEMERRMDKKISDHSESILAQIRALLKEREGT